MEASVWETERVLNMLSNDFVIITLYTDDRTALPEDMQYYLKLRAREKNQDLWSKMGRFASVKV